MAAATAGLHHVTALASDPQRNIDFYTQVLGLRLVKATVNFDAPDVHHFYYGDHAGNPGTILTFFPFTDAAPGRPGHGAAGTLSLTVPRDGFDDWCVRLDRHGVETGRAEERFGTRTLAFADPDGLRLELVGQGEGTEIGGLSAVRLEVPDPVATGAVLTGLLGYHQTARDGDLVRYTAGGDAIARNIDIVTPPAGRAHRAGAGSVHHIAFRARDRADLDDWRTRVAEAGLDVTGVRDRSYFQSIYFREPGGVLFEIATDPPGFAIDEAPAALGTALMLPPQYAHRRAEIERRLPPVRLPGGKG
jgi:glyoxalase family protein